MKNIPTISLKSTLVSWFWLRSCSRSKFHIAFSFQCFHIFLPLQVMRVQAKNVLEKQLIRIDFLLKLLHQQKKNEFFVIKNSFW